MPDLGGIVTIVIVVFALVFVLCVALRIAFWVLGMCVPVLSTLAWAIWLRDER